MKLYAKNWDDHVKIEVICTYVILLLILVEAVLAGYGLYAARQQDRILRQMANLMDRQAKLLNGIDKDMDDTRESMLTMSESIKQSSSAILTMNESLAASLQTSKKMGGLLKGQLTILDADEKRRIAELTKKPDLKLKLGGVFLATEATMPIVAVESSDSRETFILLVNEGEAQATGVLLRAFTDNAAVHFGCDCAGSPLPKLQKQETDTFIMQIGLVNAIGFARTKFWVDHPTGVGGAMIGFNIEAANFNRKPLGQVLLRWPKKT